MIGYGKEVILDLHHCDAKTMTRDSLKEYFIQLCKLIDMQRCDLHFWDDEGVLPEEVQTEPHTIGISAVQFILTSNVTIHTLTEMKNCYVNIFSCKDFISKDAIEFTRDWFHGEVVQYKEVSRI